MTNKHFPHVPKFTVRLINPGKDRESEIVFATYNLAQEWKERNTEFLYSCGIECRLEIDGEPMI